MDREFMGQFYDRFYEDAVGDALQNDQEYLRLAKKCTELGQSVGGKMTREDWADFDAYNEALNEQMSYVARAMYLKGAEDREKMLRQ